jgi:hypothetical protein
MSQTLLPRQAWTSENTVSVTHGVKTGAPERYYVHLPQYAAMQQSCYAVQALCGVEGFMDTSSGGVF